ncbi:ELD1 [Symbiodinium sp. KB8]|nr:ELD1 [Symbiodinium sp. KB8]
MAHISNDAEAVQPPGISWWDCHGLQIQYSDDAVSWDGCFLQTKHFEARTATSELPLHRPRCDHANTCDCVSVACISKDAEIIRSPGISWWDCHGLQMQYSDDAVFWDGCFLQVQHFEVRIATSELPLHRPRCDHANVCDYVSVAHISNDAEAIQPPGLSWCDYIGLEFGNFANSGPDERAASPLADKGLLQMRMALSVIPGLLGARCGIVVHLCTEDWWRTELSSSRFALRRRESAFCEETMQLFESVHDVQSRQCLAVDAAAREAQRRGYDWLLHIDSDEALYLPKHADARSFFAELPADVDQVVFNNLEAVPESFDIDDWFKDVSLFKVHQNLLRDTTDASSSKKYLEKLERWRQRQIAKGTDPEDIRTNRSFDSALLPVRIARRRAVQELRIVLPPVEEGDEEPFDSDEEPSRGARKAEFEDLPCYFVAYGNGKAACRLRSPPPLPVGVHRFGSDSNERLRSQRCTGYGAPVILHYANCGYKSWRRKYEILASGHGTEDGGFSIERKGIKSMRAHLAHRALCQRGNEEDLAKYYRTYIMGNEFGELPHFACHGLVTRIRSVQRVLREEVSPGDILKVTSPDGFDVQVCYHRHHRYQGLCQHTFSPFLCHGIAVVFSVSHSVIIISFIDREGFTVMYQYHWALDPALLSRASIERFRRILYRTRGGHVISFATHSCVLASTSKNALGLCFMGDTLHLQLKAKEPKQLLSITPMRLMKMKDRPRDGERHPLQAPASEGMVWQWLPYSPSGPPLHSPGEFSVPIDQGEVDAILAAAENGQPVPVFTKDASKSKAATSEAFLRKKEEGNALFKAGDYLKAIRAYDAALAEPCGDGDASIAQSNAAQVALLNLAGEAISKDSTNAKAFARCAAACDILGEAEAAAEFRGHASRCEAAAQATRNQRKAEEEQRQEAKRQQREKLAAAQEAERRREELLERERREEALRQAAEDDGKADATAGRLSSMLGLDANLASLGSA